MCIHPQYQRRICQAWRPLDDGGICRAGYRENTSYMCQARSLLDAYVNKSWQGNIQNKEKEKS